MMIIPILTAIIGVIIHALGLLDFIPHSSLMTDFLMLSIDSLVVYGLLKNRKWGYFPLSSAKYYATLLGISEISCGILCYSSHRVFCGAHFSHD